jgi:hypothetical protein
MKSLRSILAIGVAVGVVAVAGVAHADALGGKEPWDFTPQNRAAIAVAIKNIEDPGSAGGSGAGTIVCGGTSGASGDGGTGSASQATANSACIIINNSDGAIVQTDQDSYGDQGAGAETSATSNNLTGGKKSGGSIDEVANILSGHKQGL